MIRSFGKRRAIRALAESEARKRTETRDAILWEVLDGQQRCRVKIQGSDTIVTAYFPRNWTSTPRWMKPGNAVRLLHAGGKRSRLEVIGDGGTIPTPIPGGTAAPAEAQGADCIITGCQVHAFSGMAVKIESGTYRINDTQYTLAVGVVMGAPPIQVMGNSPVMVLGGGYTVVAVDAAEASAYRIDALFVGIDGVIEYSKGAPSTTNPIAPATPPSHLLLATVLVPPGSNEILEWYIHYNFVAPFPASLSASASLDRLTWADASATITVSVLDQYGRPITGINWAITVMLESGTGYLGYGGTSATIYTGAGDNNASITYHRIAGYDVYPYPGEHCPVFVSFELVQKKSVTTLSPIILEDEYGLPIV